jgi:hypothetical protein
LIDEARKRGLRGEFSMPVAEPLRGAIRNPRRSVGSITFENDPT